MTSKDSIDYNSSEVYKKIFSQNENKEINLGTLALGESVVVAISPLDLSIGHIRNNLLANTYDGKLTLDFIKNPSEELSIKSANMLEKGLDKEVISFKDNKKMKNKILFDVKLREEEKEVFKKIQHNESKFFSKKSLSIQNVNKIETLESKREFNVLYDIDYNLSKKITATLKAIRDNVLIYVADNVIVSSTDIDNLVDKFNDKIFPNNMKWFSSHPYSRDYLYDIDENGKPIILITATDPDVLGFFRSWDYIDAEGSNLADMFYINVDAFSDSDYTIDDIAGVLAHEFQHLIYFIEKNIALYESGADVLVEDTWMNEGFSMLAMYLNGYYQYNTSREYYFLNKPSNESLLYWGNNNGDYGASGLFALYLYDRFGIDIIKEIVSDWQNPIDTIEQNIKYKFQNLFLDWAASIYLSHYNTSEIYDYPITLIIKPHSEDIQSSGNYYFTVNSSAIKYYRIVGNGSEVNLTIDLPEKTGVIIYRDNY